MTLAQIRSDRMPCPAVPEGTKTALCLFSAGFLGRNVEIHLLDAGVTEALCVDCDRAKLDEMRELYPEAWTFVDYDAYRILWHVSDRHFDLVTADPPLCEMERVFKLLPMLKRIGTHGIVGTNRELIMRKHDCTITKRTEESYWLSW